MSAASLEQPTYASETVLADVTAVITAGGGSRRLGRDKALETLCGQRLLERVAASLAPFERRLLVGPAEAYAFLGWPAVPDRLPGVGPLGGLATALAEVRTPWLAFCAVDLPLLTPGYWRLLARARREGASAVVALDARERVQPLAALYHQAARPAVEARLAAGALAMRDLVAALPGQRLAWASLLGEGLPEGLFTNVNREEDLVAARRALGR